MNAIIHFTFIFGVVPRDAIEEKRVPRLVRPPSFSSTPAPFLIPESCEENSQLNDRPTVLLCRPQLFAYFSYLYVASAHSQPASRTINSLLPILYPLLHRIRSSVSVGRSLPGSLVDPCLLASLPVFRSVASRARFVCLHCVGFILPACLLHTIFLGPSAKMIKNPPSVQFRGGGEEARFFARKRRALFFN